MSDNNNYRETNNKACLNCAFFEQRKHTKHGKYARCTINGLVWWFDYPERLLEITTHICDEWQAIEPGED